MPENENPIAPASIATSPAVDLSRLPPPQLIDQPDFETRRQDKLDRFAALAAQQTALVASDPAVKLIEADTYDEMVLAAAFNDAAKSLLLAFATGAALDHLGALMGVERLSTTGINPMFGEVSVPESDDDFRERILIAPNSFSVAGPELAYIFHARSANSDVIDASATSPAPGQVLVSLLARPNIGDGDGTATAQMIADVTAIVNDDAVRPLTDQVTVASADIINFDIEANLFRYSGPDSSLILQTARDTLDAFLSDNRRLGRDITKAGIISALKVAGIQNVLLSSPANDVVVGPAQAAYAQNIMLTDSGIAE